MLRFLICKLENLCYNNVSWLKTLFFNFYYLPIRQAVKLPILLHKPRFYRTYGGRSFFFNLGGSVKIENDDVYHGMIKLGFVTGTSYQDIGFIWSNSGSIIFKGECVIGQGCSIRNIKGELIFGDKFKSNYNSHFICEEKIEFGNYSGCSWDCTFCDTDFHSIKNVYTGKKSNPRGPIIIGDYSWICQSSVILKNTKLPNYTIVSTGSVLTGKFKCKEKSIVAGNPAKLILEGEFYRDINDD